MTREDQGRLSTDLLKGYHRMAPASMAIFNMHLMFPTQKGRMGVENRTAQSSLLSQASSRKAGTLLEVPLCTHQLVLEKLKFIVFHFPSVKIPKWLEQ